MNLVLKRFGHPGPPYNKHCDVEYLTQGEGRRWTSPTFSQAVDHAVRFSLDGDKKVYIEVLVYSELGAEHYGGDQAVQKYKADPVTLFDRIELTAKHKGAAK